MAATECPSTRQHLGHRLSQCLFRPGDEKSITGPGYGFPCGPLQQRDDRRTDLMLLFVVIRTAYFFRRHARHTELTMAFLGQCPWCHAVSFTDIDQVRSVETFLGCLRACSAFDQSQALFRKQL